MISSNHLTPTGYKFITDTSLALIQASIMRFRTSRVNFQRIIETHRFHAIESICAYGAMLDAAFNGDAADLLSLLCEYNCIIVLYYHRYCRVPAW